MKFIFLVFLLFSCRLGDKFVFTPNKQKFNQCSEADKLGLISISKKIYKSKEKIRYYYRSVKAPKAFLIFFHGSGRSACSNLEIYPNLKDLPLNILWVEYPGFGGDKKQASEKRILPNMDLFMKEIKKFNTRKLPVIAYGGSMGTTIATYFASKFKVNGLILRSAPTSIIAAAKALNPRIPLLGKLIGSHFRADLWAPKVKTSVLMLHGDRDDWVPLKMGKRQARNFKNARNVSFVTVKGAAHMDIYKFDLYKRKILAFIKKILKL